MLSSHVRLGTGQVFHPPATALGYSRTAGGGNSAVFSPLSPLAVPLLLKPLHLASGRWLTLRAARMGTARPAEQRDIAVSIEPAAPGDRVAVFARASGLTPRETELLHHLVTGASTQDITGHMFVSEHTVQDHLKSIFAKTATRNRRVLLARALGT